MTPEQLSAAIVDVLTALFEEGALTLPDGVPGAVTVERPRQREHGDYATNVALQLAKKAGTNPRDLAGSILDRLVKVDGVAAVELAGPGFLNITVEAGAQGVIAEEIVAAGRQYGRSAEPHGGKVNVEFISANPTGPLHLGHTRWAVVGDALARVLEAAGAEVAREFYINDRGRQMDLFGESLAAAAMGLPVPDDGYHGAYIADLAKQVVEDAPDTEGMEAFREAGYALQLKEQQDELARFNTRFDVWFSERDLHRGDVAAQLEKLRDLGHLYDADGALWMRTTDFGDDKDRVLIRTDGSPTYFAADAAYYLSKKDRGFAEKVYLLGADHHGYINRLKAIAACAGDDPEHNIEVKIGQLISIAGQRMGKRLGNAIYLDELIEWIGKDAVRYSLARYPADSPLSLDGEELRKQSNDNPVFYVQYAHARTANVARLAGEDGVRRSDGFDASLLTDPTEAALLAVLGDFPRVVAQAAHLLEPHRVARYLEELAGRFHKWYDTCRVRPVSVDEEVTDLHRSRLWLNDATRQVLANGLDLLGVSAPERM